MPSGFGPFRLAGHAASETQPVPIALKDTSAHFASQGRFLGQPHRSELLLLGLLLTVGTYLSLVTPLGGGWDEETHMIRVWELAHIHLIPNELPKRDLPYPAIYWELSYRRQLTIRPVEPDFWTKYGSLAIGAMGYIDWERPGTQTRSVYSPPLLLPQTLVMRYLGLKYQLPALIVFYAGRLAGLLTYTALAWLALRLAPFGKWVVVVAALSPTAVFQAATIGADPVSNGLALLFIAGCLRISDRKQIGWAAWCGQVGLAFLLFWAKVNLIFLALLPLIILQSSRFKMRGGKLLLTAAMAILCVAEVGGWSVLAYPHLGTTGSEVSPLGQAAAIIRQPLSFLAILLSDLWANGAHYLGQSIAEYGYGYGLVPSPVFLLYAIAIVAAWRADSSGRQPTARERRGLGWTFLVSVLGTSLAMYLAFTAVGAGAIEGIQGRYYVAIAPLLGLAAIGWLPLTPRPRASAVAVACSATALAGFALGAVLSYHVLCGRTYFQPGLCHLPLFKNWDPNRRLSPPISSLEALTQEFVSECPGLTEVRVWVSSQGLPPEGQTHFSFSDTATQHVIAVASVANAGLPPGGWYVLPFPAEWHSQGRRYSLRLEPAQVQGAVGTRVALSLQPEFDGGTLLENQTPLDIDTGFRYGCITGLGKYVPILSRVGNQNP